jgi:transcriptional regulator with XRE-family HTH domain
VHNFCKLEFLTTFLNQKTHQMTFGEKLAKLREKHALTQPDLMNGLNTFCKRKKIESVFTVEQIKQWEGNHNLPNMERSIIISKFFSVSLDSLFKPEQRIVNSKILLKNIILN